MKESSKEVSLLKRQEEKTHGKAGDAAHVGAASNEQTGHTPGPWHVNGYRACISTQSPSDPPTVRARTICYMQTERRGMPITTTADARLITAAPDLLEACELAQAWLANCLPIGDLSGPKPMPILASAIAKAAGGTHERVKILISERVRFKSARFGP